MGLLDSSGNGNGNGNGNGDGNVDVDVDDDVKKKKRVTNTFSFTCVTCLCPNQSLYKQYSTAKNIKLTSCPSCERDVDPYIERELLLVVMDMILLRLPAYRHLLFNRTVSMGMGMGMGKGDARNDNDKGDRGSNNNNNVEVRSHEYGTGNALICGIVICSMFKSFLKHQAYYTCDTTCTAGADAVKLFVMSWMECTSLLVGTSVTAIFARRQFQFERMNVNVNVKKVQKRKKKKPKPLPPPYHFWREMNLAIIIPQLFHAITLAVHIYEDSSTVRMLGSLFVLCFNYLAVHCCMERMMVWSSAVAVVSQQTDSDGDGNGDVDGGAVLCYHHKAFQHNNETTTTTTMKTKAPRWQAAMPGWPFLVGFFMEIITRCVGLLMIHENECGMPNLSVIHILI